MAARVFFSRTLQLVRSTKLAQGVLPKSSVGSFQTRSIYISRILADRYYSKDHEWIDVADGVGTVGITNHAQDSLGELVYVELPEVDSEVSREDTVGAVESVKAASDVYTPISGLVVDINEALTTNPSLANQSAESDGWMFKIKLSDPDELGDLMDLDGYKKFVEEAES